MTSFVEVKFWYLLWLCSHGSVRVEYTMIKARNVKIPNVYVEASVYFVPPELVS